MGFSRQEYWSGLPFPPLGDLPDPGIEPMSPVSPALAGDFFTTEPPGKCKALQIPKETGVQDGFELIICTLWHKQVGFRMDSWELVGDGYDWPRTSPGHWAQPNFRSVWWDRWQVAADTVARDQETQRGFLVNADVVARPTDGTRQANSWEQSRWAGLTWQPVAAPVSGRTPGSIPSLGGQGGLGLRVDRQQSRLATAAKSYNQ